LLRKSTRFHDKKTLDTKKAQAEMTTVRFAGWTSGKIAEVSMDRISIGYPASYLLFFWIRIGFGY